MHKVLLIPELVESILAHVVSRDNHPEPLEETDDSIDLRSLTAQSIRDLQSLGLSAKVFREPSLASYPFSGL